MKRSALIVSILSGVAILTGCALQPLSQAPEPRPTAAPEAATEPGSPSSAADSSAESGSEAPVEEVTVDEVPRVWITAANLAISLNDPQYIKMVSSPDCGVCRKAVAAADSRTQDGTRIEDNLMTVLSVHTGPATCRDGFCRTEVLAQTHQQDGVLVLRDGTREPIRGGDVEFRFTVLSADGGLLVEDVDILPPNEGNA